MEKLVQLFPHEVKRIFSKYGPIHKQTSDYQDLKMLFVTPIYYGFKEYFNRKKTEFRYTINVCVLFTLFFTYFFNQYFKMTISISFQQLLELNIPSV